MDLDELRARLLDEDDLSATTVAALLDLIDVAKQRTPSPTPALRDAVCDTARQFSFGQATYADLLVALRALDAAESAARSGEGKP